mgnify:CR=1 FL=1
MKHENKNVVFGLSCGDWRVTITNNPRAKYRHFTCWKQKEDGNKMELANFDNEEKARIYADGIEQGMNML